MITTMDSSQFTYHLQERFKGMKEIAKQPILGYLVELALEMGSWFSIVNEKGDGQLYRFTTELGCYDLVPLTTIGCFLKRILNETNWLNYSNSHRNEFYAQLVQEVVLTEEQQDQINNYPGIIPFRDCYYNEDTQETFAPTPQFYFTTTLSVCLGKTGECPKFQALLAYMLPDEENRLKVLRYMRYCLGPSIAWQFHQIWTGPPGTGKTELSKLFHLMMPKLVTNVPLDVLMEKDKNRFILSEFRGKWVNLGSEITVDALTPNGVGLVKRLATNEFLRSEEKQMPGKSGVKNLLKAIYDVNELPLPTTFTDLAFFERMEVIEFQQIIPERDRMVNAIDDIWDAEGPELVRFLLGIDLKPRYRCEGEEMERLWRRNTHSVFIYNETCLVDGDSTVQALYNNYCLWCTDTKRRPATIHHFGRLLKSVGIDRHRTSFEGNYEYHYNTRSTYKESVNGYQLLDVSKVN